MKGPFFAAALCLVAWPSTGKAAFATCEDAWNYGSNTASLYAGSFYNTLACDAGEREEAEMEFAGVMSRFVAEGVDADDHLLCMYSGLYTGLLQRTSVEYSKCDHIAFRCLEPVTVGSYAAAVLAALYEAVEYPTSLTAEDIEDNFALVDVPLGGDPVCCVGDARTYYACKSSILEFLEENGSEAGEELVDQLVESNCVRL